MHQASQSVLWNGRLDTGNGFSRSRPIGVSKSVPLDHEATVLDRDSTVPVSSPTVLMPKSWALKWNSSVLVSKSGILVSNGRSAESTPAVPVSNSPDQVPASGTLSHGVPGLCFVPRRWRDRSEDLPLH